MKLNAMTMKSTNGKPSKTKQTRGGSLIPSPPVPTTLEEARAALGAIVDAQPYLLTHGFVEGFDAKLRTPAQRAAYLAEERSSLKEGYAECFRRCCEWLAAAPRRRTVNRRRSSYGIKHIAEGVTGEYIPNGVLIAAAVHMGIVHKPCRRNALLGIREPWLVDQEREPGE